MTTYIGTPTSRVDGRAKVTGAAQYAGEFNAPDLVYGNVVTSTIPKGRIKRIDASRALAVEGVIDVLTHENRPKMAGTDKALQRRRRARAARRSARSTTTRSCSTGSRSRWWSPKSGRLRASPPRWCAIEYEAEASVTDLHARLAEAYRGRQARQAARRCGESLCGRRRAPRGRIFHSDRASQPDGVVCLDRGRGTATAG